MVSSQDGTTVFNQNETCLKIVHETKKCLRLRIGGILKLYEKGHPILGHPSVRLAFRNPGGCGFASLETSESHLSAADESLGCEQMLDNLWHSRDFPDHDGAEEEAFLFDRRALGLTGRGFASDVPFLLRCVFHYAREYPTQSYLQMDM
jgi:hypothetical protein